MIIDDLNNINYCSKFSPIIKEALSFIKLSRFEERHCDINEYMVAVLQTSLPKSISEQKLEIHKRHVDLQYVVEGYDVFIKIINCQEIYLFMMTSLILT